MTPCMSFPTRPMLLEHRAHVVRQAAIVSRSRSVDPDLGCELVFHVLRSRVFEISARFLDLAARIVVAAPPKSIIVSAAIQRKPNTAVAAKPKKSNNK